MVSETVQHSNHLIHETSPYLLQHVHNPVDWYPWGDEALSRARNENRLIFLSIGYSSCHWCHVMAHESFENDSIAEFLNQHFVCIKVDREERPDLDAIYMAAVMALTGSGGWPLSIFLTPDLKPFYGGTYYPPFDNYGRPGFPAVLHGVLEAWAQRPKDVWNTAEELTRHIRAPMDGGAPLGTPLSAAVTSRAAEALKENFDPQFGGWGGAPKFPSSGAIELLLRLSRHGRENALLDMALHTLDCMADGGIHDQLGGGFHRYAVDGQWLVPHFEKMLYDNAQLALAYLEAYQMTDVPRYRQVVCETLDYILRDLRDPLGGFHSAEDADSEGQEGRFYIWTQQEVLEALGRADGDLFCAYYAVGENGNFESHERYHAGKSILHLDRNPAEIAQDFGLSVAALEQRMAELRAKMRGVRARRVRPGLDDKVLTAWNALTISALARAAQVLEDARYRHAADEAGRFLRTHMMRDGALLRTHRRGESRIEGYLDDYAAAINAYVDLYEMSFDRDWLDAAAALASGMIARFWDGAAHRFYYTAADQPDLILRTTPAYDGAEPSGNSMAALALLRLGALAGKRDLHDVAARVIESHAGLMERSPLAFLKMLCAADLLLQSVIEVVVAGPPNAPETQTLLRVIHGTYVPNKVVALRDPADAAAEDHPLLAGKTMLEGQPTAYLCRDFTCGPPITSPGALFVQLARSELNGADIGEQRLRRSA